MPSRKLHRDAEQPDGERDAGAIDEAREQIVAELVGAENMEIGVLGRAKQMQPALEQPPELILLSLAEETQLLDLGRIGGVFGLQRDFVALEVIAIDERADEFALVEQMHAPAAAHRRRLWSLVSVP